MSRYESNKRYREKRKPLGLCIGCSRKASPGKSMCEVCLAKRREKRKAQNPLFCGECKKLIRPEERTGRIFHKLCAEKRLARKYLLQHRLAALAYQRRHKEMGLCPRCPKKVVKWGLCRKHQRMAKQRYERAVGHI